ncbi:MAG: hypothetical protein GY694_04135 [Gammaproteobacteria bacterium]|nr:hypothetical protein [Gammaproteobacteria bacterium]
MRKSKAPSSRLAPDALALVLGFAVGQHSCSLVDLLANGIDEISHAINNIAQVNGASNQLTELSQKTHDQSSCLALLVKNLQELIHVFQSS